jgi:hypothetical protein
MFDVVQAFLCCSYGIKNLTALQKTKMFARKSSREDRFDSKSNNFLDKLVAEIAKGNWSIISKCGQVIGFWNECKASGV